MREDKGHEDFEVNQNCSNMDILLRAIDHIEKEEEEALRSAIPKKHRSVRPAHGDTGGRNGSKRSHEVSGFQGDIGFKNEKKEENLSMRSKKRQKLDMLPPDLLEDLKERIQGGEEVVKVIEKALSETDVNKKDVIQVWTFRDNKKQLCLALVIKCGENTKEQQFWQWGRNKQHAKERQFWQWGRNKQRRKIRKRGVWRCWKCTNHSAHMGSADGLISY